MRISIFLVAAVLLAAGCNAQRWKGDRKFPFPIVGKDCSRDSPLVKCSSNLDCLRSCRSDKFECVGCPTCPNSPKIDGNCFLKGTVAVRCAAPSPDAPGCTPPPPPPPPPPSKCTREGNQKCLSDLECKKCGKGFECKKCPPNGCPGREIGTCLPKEELIFCTLEICSQDPPPNIPVPTPSPTPSPKCERGGCSGELCVDSKTGPIFSGCVFRPEFACFKNAECGNFGLNGGCGFKQTEELKACLIREKAKPVG